MVVLIRKNRPEWQAGKLNGVGGHVEDTETYQDCMVREFKEEAGILVPKYNWTRFVIIRSPAWTVAFFRATVESFDGIETKTDETIVFADAFNLPSDTVPNVQWLVPMARVNEPMSVVVDYS